ncbi:VOC family protein [Candidatus Thalassolituus haligoni]|uniref:VOC family protein n=1 Tax=Candidatus Thalassolituus haligoni TaxID=3100113 RepID=UPI003511F827
MSEIQSLGYMVLEVSSLENWRSFAAELLGLQIGSCTDTVINLRMDEREQRIQLVQGEKDDLFAIGWEFKNLVDLNQYIETLKSKGVVVNAANEELCLQRKVESLYVCDDINGYTNEFFTGPVYAPISSPFYSSKLIGDGFETGELGLGHALVVARDYQASVDFYTQKLGLKITDYIRDSSVFPGVTVDATFMHTKTGRHHSLATAAMPSAKILQHMMIQVKDLNDVGLAFDRMKAANIPVIMGIGHHPNDKMVSFYIVTPSGFGLEFGFGGIVVDDNDWHIKTYQQLSDWGHEFQIKP